MDTPSLKKGTTSEVMLLPQYDRDGAMVVLVLIKERFSVDRRNRVTRVGGAEIHVVDVPWDEDAPETSTIKFPSDLVLRKPSTDVVVVGAAMAPYRSPVTELDVLVRVGSMQKVLRVHGTRVWYKALMGLGLTKPEPFEALPLRWEYAWGGADFSDPKRPLEEPRNPAGRGIGSDASKLVHTPGPQIEDPVHPITTNKSNAPPAGVASLGRHWVPRRNYTGTIDEQWMDERMPLLPLDFDERFYQVATPDLIAPQPLRGGEKVQIVHMNDQGPLDFELPKMHFFVGGRTDDGLKEYRTSLDTVLLQPNDRTVDMTWSAIVPLPRRADDLHFIQVHEKRALS